MRVTNIIFVCSSVAMLGWSSVCLALATPALAPLQTGTAPPEPEPEPETEEAVDEDEEVVDEDEEMYTSVVTATKLGRAASDFTFDLGIISTVPLGSTSDLLRLAPGLEVTQHSGYGKAHRIFLRGFDAVHGQDLEIRVAGIPINEPSCIHAPGYADLHFVIPELVSSLRVLEGAYDPRQGDFAVAGSAWFDLGMERRGFVGSFSGGRFLTFEGLVGWGPRSMGPDTFLVASFARSSGFGPSRAWMNGRFMGQGVWEVGEARLRLLVTSYAGRFDSAGVVRADDLGDGTMGFYDTYDPRQDGLSMRHQLLLGVGGQHWDVAGYVVRRDLVLHHDFTGFALDMDGDLTEQVQAAWTIGGRGAYRKPFTVLGFEQLFEAGVEFRHDIIDQEQSRLHHVDGHPYRSEIRAGYGITDIALFVDLDVHLLGWLRIRGGVRADALTYAIHDRLLEDRRSAMGFHVGPKATVELIPHELVSVFLSYGNGFRSPHALSLGDGERTPFTTVHAGELGLRVALRDVVTVTLTGFTTYVEEDVVFDHATARNVFSGETLRGGVGLLAWTRPVGWLELALSGTFTHAAYLETGELLPYAPRLVVRADVHAERAVWRFRGRDLVLMGGLGARLVGPRPLPYDEWTRTLLLADLQAGVSICRLTVKVEILNLLNTRWRDDEFVYISSFDRDAPAPDLVPQRHFTAGHPITVMATVEVNI